MARSNIKPIIADCEYLGRHRQLVDRLRVRLTVSVRELVMASEHGGDIRWPSRFVFDAYVSEPDDRQSRGRIVTFLLLGSRTEGLGVSELQFWFEDTPTAYQFVSQTNQILQTVVHREPPAPPRRKP